MVEGQKLHQEESVQFWRHLLRLGIPLWVDFQKDFVHQTSNVISAIQANGFALRAICLLLQDLATLLSVTQKRPCTINNQTGFQLSVIKLKPNQLLTN